MRPSEANLLADQLGVNLRWLTLLGLGLYLGWHQALDQAALIIMFIAIAWNLLLFAFQMSGRRLPQHVYFTIAFDALLAVGMFLIIQAKLRPLAWAGLLPVLTTALYYGSRGALIGAAGVTLGFSIVLAILVPEPMFVLDTMLIPVIGYFAIGVGGGFAAERFGRQIRQQIGSLVSSRRKAQQLDQERLEAIYAITTTLTSTLKLERLLDLALDVAANVIIRPDEAGTGLVSAFLLATGGRLIVGTGRRMNPGDLKAVLPGNSGLVLQALESGDPLMVPSPEHDPELRRITAFHTCHQVYIYPLRSNTEIYGALAFGHADPRFFDDIRLEILEIVGRQSLVALRNAELYRELEREKARMMEVQEEGQKKLARDLHDGPTQSVAAIAMRVNFTRRLLERDPKAAGDELFKIEDLARRTTKEIRHMLFTLRPLVLESSGLVAALQSMADKMKETYAQNVVVEAEPAIVDMLEIGKQAVLFYITEEAVNNARKHAEAQQITVRLKPSPRENVALLEVQDNGVGFDVGAVDAGYENRGSLGMVNMRERAQMLNGLLKLESKVGQGTRIRVWVPLNEDAALALRKGA
jgi:signal transduction histidine kinase